MTTLTDSRNLAGAKSDKKDKKDKKPKGPKGKKDKGKKKKKDKCITAKSADRHVLYEQSVQDPEAEVDLIDQAWREQRGRTCNSIREDFCGTAVVCMEWVKRRRANTAIGVDLDGEVLGWGRDKISERLNDEQATRVELRQENVLTVDTPKVDSVLAMNFSYYILQKRSEMLAYFKAAYEALNDDGLFLLDAYGGSDSFTEMEEERDCDGFTYVWDQHEYDPISGQAVNYIHFRFEDGTELDRAFEYTWRLWTLPEIRDVLMDAGFKDVVVYWEGEEEDSGEGNGEWAVATKGEACPGWIAYVVGKK